MQHQMYNVYGAYGVNGNNEDVKNFQVVESCFSGTPTSTNTTTSSQLTSRSSKKRRRLSVSDKSAIQTMIDDGTYRLESKGPFGEKVMHEDEIIALRCSICFELFLSDGGSFKIHTNRCAAFKSDDTGIPAQQPGQKYLYESFDEDVKDFGPVGSYFSATTASASVESEDSRSPTPTTPVSQGPKRRRLSAADKAVIQKFIEDGTYHLEPKGISGSKIMHNDEIVALRCNVCQKCFLSDGGSFKIHVDCCFSKTSVPTRSELPEEVRTELKGALILLASTSGIPLDFLTSPAIMEFIQTVGDMYYEAGKKSKSKNSVAPDVRSFLFTNGNLSRDIATIGREATQVISTFIRLNKSRGGCHLVIDLTSKKQRHYIGAVIHVLSAKNEMVALPVALKQFTQRPTTPDLEKFVEELKTEYAIDGFDTVVSGERADGYKIPALKRNLVCAAHSLHTVAKRAIFPDKKGDKSLSIDGQLDESAKAVLKDLGKTIHLIRIFVVYVREHPRLLDSLPSLSDENDTRWMGFFTLTKNFIQLKPGDLEIISSYLETNDAQDREAYGEALTKIRNKTDALKKFVSVYQDLFDALHLLGDDQKPTIHLVSPTYFKLVKRFDQHAASEDALTSALGKAVVFLLRKKEEAFLGEIQLATCFLDTTWGDVADTLGREAGLKARSALHKFVTAEIPASAVEERPANHPRAFLLAPVADAATQADREINDYFCTTPEDSASGNLIMNWANCPSRWKFMSSVARHLLCVPASCSGAEGLFSYFRASVAGRPSADTSYNAQVAVRTAKEKLGYSAMCDWKENE